MAPPANHPTRRRRAGLGILIPAAMTATLAVTLAPAGPATAGAPALASAATVTGLPIPQVTGPLRTTPTSYPFGGAEHQSIPQRLSDDGYVEQEFMVSGTANVYDWPAPGPAVVRTADAPYTTRILVRRPAEKADFSGNVIVEMLNPSNLFDLNIGWALSHDQFMERGDVWVGITAKPVAVEALKNFDPQRYASLSMANPLPLDDPRNCTDIRTLIRGDSSRATENGLVWDIHRQVASWLRSTEPSNPLTYGASGGRRTPVQKLYAFGYSQTGGFLHTYINAIHPLDVQALGRSLFDGYLVAVAGGAFAGTDSINQCADKPAVGDPRRQIAPAGVPVIHVMSESDYLIGIAGRRPDSNTRADKFRHYEVPGMGHATPDELYWSAAPEDIVKAGRPVPAMSCAEGPRSRFPSRIVFDAAFRNLDRWSRFGIAAPRVAPITVVDGAGVRDDNGNLVGGYRTPYVDVPTSTWLGSSTGGGFCGIAGHEVPLSAARLTEVYGTRAHYVRLVQRNVQLRVAQRLLTPADAADIVFEATYADIPGFDPVL